MTDIVPNLASTQMNVPQQINGMAVIEYASLDLPRLRNSSVSAQSGRSLQTMAWVAISRASDSQGYCTVFCDADWNGLTSEFNETLLDARLAPHRSFAQDVDWHLAGYSIANYFSVAQKYFVYSIIAAILLSAVRLSPDFARLLTNSLIVEVAALAIGAIFIVSLLTIWVLVGYVATKSGGWAYGLMHVALVVLLTPVCFVGLFAIPALVKGDLSRWHDWNESQRNPHTTFTPT